MSINILIVENEHIIAEDLEIMLINSGYTVIGKAYTYTMAMDFLAGHKPDIVLLDISLGSHSGTGLDIGKALNEKYSVPFIYITSFSDSLTLHEAKQTFPSGYIVKPFRKKDIIAAIEMASVKVNSAKKSPYLNFEQLNEKISSPLTHKEYEILKDLAKGMSNDELSKLHFISLNTVKSHLKNIFQKMEVPSRGLAILKILE